MQTGNLVRQLAKVILGKQESSDIQTVTNKGSQGQIQKYVKYLWVNLGRYMPEVLKGNSKY